MHVLILSGGTLNISFAKNYCRTLSFDKVFAVDKGLEYAVQLGLTPNLIIGDFDTVNVNLLSECERQIMDGSLDAILEKYPVKKDATDTELALLDALKIGATEITMLAVTGSRLDHVLMNMNLLLQAEEAGISCYMVDETNRIQLLSDHARKETEVLKEKQHGRYLSIIPVTPLVEGLTITGVAYPLENKQIKQGNTLTVSNCIVDEKAQIRLERGSIWVIESKD